MDDEYLSNDETMLKLKELIKKHNNDERYLINLLECAYGLKVEPSQEEASA